MFKQVERRHSGVLAVSIVLVSLEPSQPDLGGDGGARCYLLGQHGSGCQGGQGSAGNSELEEGLGEGHEFDDGLRSSGERMSRGGRSLARRWICVWLCSTFRCDRSQKGFPWLHGR